VEWIHLVEDREKWWALVNAVMNLRVPEYVRNSFTSGVTRWSQLVRATHEVERTDWMPVNGNVMTSHGPLFLPGQAMSITKSSCA
jgi:hypothetical protein